MPVLLIERKYEQKLFSGYQTSQSIICYLQQNLLVSATLFSI